MGKAEDELVAHVVAHVGWFYVLCAAVNLLAAGRSWQASRRFSCGLWAAVAGMFALLAALAFGGFPGSLPAGIKDVLNALANPMLFSLDSFVALSVLYLGRRFFATPAVAFALLNLSLLWMGLSLTDPAFAAVIVQPDHVAIVALVYLLAGLSWWATAQAVENDRRYAEAALPVESQYRQKVLAWPDLVYPELICMILVMVVLLLWSLAIKAPLESPANPAVTPNPSKAPWYFVGLQEMLCYSDAWYVGVVVPCLIIFGLMAIPYLDCNPDGNGYYTIARRRFAYKTFQFGFLLLWVLLILIGTFLRGPNWTSFGPYEPRDPHKTLAIQNVKLSEYFWRSWLGREMPQAPAGAGTWQRAGYICEREIAGLVTLILYFVALPPLLGATLLRRLRRQLGRGRYLLMTFLLLMMLTVPLKIILRWSFHLNYLVSMPEYLLNF